MKHSKLKVKLLLVEDNINMRSYLKTILNSSCEIVAESSNGKLGVSLYEKYKPDYVLMDIELEEMDGLAAANLILKFDNDAKIVFLTQYKDHTLKQRIEKLNSAHYFTKEHIHLVKFFFEKLSTKEHELY